jgi:Predicted periplasmic or secreted lipoprotein
MKKLITLVQMLTFTLPLTAAHAADTVTNKVEPRPANVAVTPMDQSTDPKDVQLTQTIRQKLMDDKSLSFTAQNIKIVTQNGKVILDGSVPTEKDRSRVELLARQAAGGKAVTNQIKISK